MAFRASRTKYIHVKDARRGRRGYVVVGTGDIPYVSIFPQLQEAGVEPVICLETHLGGLFRGRTSARCLTNLINSIRTSGYDFGKVVLEEATRTPRFLASPRYHTGSPALG